MTMHTLRTDLTLSFAGYEVTLPLAVTYWHRKAFDGGRSEPSTPEHVEIGSVYADLPDGERHPVLTAYAIEMITPQLEAACLEGHRGAIAYERDQIADMIREERVAMRRPQAAAE